MVHSSLVQDTPIYLKSLICDMFVSFQSNAKINLPGCRKITNFDSLLGTKTAYIIGFDTKRLFYGRNTACFIFTLVKTLLNPNPMWKLSCGTQSVKQNISPVLT